MSAYRSLAAACTIAASTLMLQGCGAIVRSAIDTQPRVSLTAAAFADPAAIVHGTPVVFAPGNADEAVATDPDLVRFAPVIVQGFQAKGREKYPHASDAIGTPALSADGDDVRIDTREPAVFARVEQALLGNSPLKQLVYVFWYPERPVGSIEKGDIDGGILRVTLDSGGNPAVFEYSQPCGCFHGVFVAEHVEAAAKAQFPTVARDRLYAVEAPLGGPVDWVVRDLIHVEPSHRPVLYMSAGKHFCEAIRFEEPPATGGTSGSLFAYTLRSYSVLEHLPRAGGLTGSMFNEKGLVHGGKRWKENLVLTGLDNPGWPRHLDRMKIHWDRDTWTDQHLLEKRLRLPAAVTGQVAAAAPSPHELDVSPGAGGHAPGPAVEGDSPVLILFTNRYCIGCEEVKRVVLSDPDVQAAITAWGIAPSIPPSRPRRPSPHGIASLSRPCWLPSTGRAGSCSAARRLRPRPSCSRSSRRRGQRLTACPPPAHPAPCSDSPRSFSAAPTARPVPDVRERSCASNKATDRMRQVPAARCISDSPAIQHIGSPPMTPSPHSLVRVAAVLFCLCFLAACRSDSRAAPHEGDQVSDSGDSFKGEPRVTADVHYATAQVFESKIATRGANGTRPDAKNVAQLQNAALNQYAAGLKLDPQHTPCLHRSASLLSSMGRHEQALAMWQRYVTATGRTPSSLVNLGLANELAEQPDAAEKAYREATQLDPSHKPAHVNLGLLLAKQGQLQPAQAALSTVLSPAATHWHMGVALQAAGRTKDADQHFRAAAALDPAYAKRPAPPADQSARIE